jgi:CelD/BcsL family acetyltransferase involved in cellulose biosynthesis
VTVSDGQNTVGVAPLYGERTAAGNRVMRFMGEGRADYCDLLAGASQETVAAMVRVLSDYPDWDLVDLGGIPSESATVPALKARCEAAGLRVMVRDESICPSLVLRGHEASVRELINKPSLRRRQRNLERCGRLEFLDLRSAADVEPQLEQFFDQHTARWRMTSAPSLFHDNANRAFYRELTSRLDLTGWLLFTAIRFEDRPIAYHYGFDYNDVLLYYKPSFDPALAARSPGLVLVRHLIARALESGRRELDFTIGDEPFKQRFTNTMRKTVKVQIFRNQALYFFERSRRGVLSAMRRAVTKMRAH